jgi:GTPase SAR1 family protein
VSQRSKRAGSRAGVKLIRTFEGHTSTINSLDICSSGQQLASASADGDIKLWDVESGHLLHTLEGYGHSVRSVVFSPNNTMLASGGADCTVRLWDALSGTPLFSLVGHKAPILSVAYNPSGTILASGGSDDNVHMWSAFDSKPIKTHTAHGGGVHSVAFNAGGTLLAGGTEDGPVLIWDADTGRLLRKLEGHRSPVYAVMFHPLGRVVTTASHGNVMIWELSTGKLLRTLEGQTGMMSLVSYDPKGLLLATRSQDSIRLWDLASWSLLTEIPLQMGLNKGLAFHPTLPHLLVPGPLDHGYTRSRAGLHIFELDLELLEKNRRNARQPKAVHYVNAKVVLVGDTGVGKSGLALVLNGQPYEKTDSTSGRHVWTFGSSEARVGADNRIGTRETLLWDLAGQPGYHVIHQLHLNEVAVALIVFDARSETDPLAGVRHWERALRVAQQRQGVRAIPLRKFLVSARADRGGVSVSKERIDGIVREFGIDGYFATSAKEGWQIAELRTAIENGINWAELPVVTSTTLFAAIKSFLLDVKKTGQLLAPVSDLLRLFKDAGYTSETSEANLRDNFTSCIGRLENRDLIRPLSFGDYVLLQPELLDAYASAMVVTAKDEPDGLGSISEQAALGGHFHVPEEHRIKDSKQEQLLLHATTEELVQHDLALRESSVDGGYLVFPSQFNRDYEDAPEPPGRTLAISFEGPTQSVYSTLAVRLGHSGLFETTRAEMWRNAAVFNARAGGIVVYISRSSVKLEGV